MNLQFIQGGFLICPSALWRQKKQLLPCSVKIDICGGKGDSLYFSILECNHMSPGREQFYFSLEHSTSRAASQSSFSPCAKCPLFRKPQLFRNMKILMASYFPTRIGIIRILFFRVWFEARMRLYRYGDKKQRKTRASQDRDGDSVCFLQCLRGKPCPHRAFHWGVFTCTPRCILMRMRTKADANHCTCILPWQFSSFPHYFIMRQKLVHNGISRFSTRYSICKCEKY